jgi:uncharacterized membrane protein
LVLAGALSVLNLWLDTHITLAPKFGQYFGINLGGFDNIRSVLSTTAAAILGVAGVSFSITIASLTLASQQFGPRLIRTFIRDRFIQLTLGFFVATFFYCMLTMQLGTVYTNEIYVPFFSLITILVVTFIDLVLLVLFIHHICVAIQVDSVVSEVVTEMHERAQHLFSEEHKENCDIPDKLIKNFASNFSNPSAVLTAHCDGYITYINYGVLLAQAEEASVLTHVLHRAGDYVMTGEALIAVVGDPGKDTLSSASKYVIIGETRTPVQDLEYTVRQLVEIALRALSPGINDPFTAMTSIDRLGSLLNFVGSRSIPPTLMEDSNGKPRLLRDYTNYQSLVEAAFNQIRQACTDRVDVSMRLLETFTALMQLT